MGVLQLALVALAAGLNPWLALLITVGLATFTRRVPVQPPFDAVIGGFGIPLLAALAVLLGVEVVAGKMPRLAQWTERIHLPAAALAGALLGSALASPLRGDDGRWAAAFGAALAAGVRLGRRRAATAANRRLWRLGYVAVDIAANLLSAAITATAFALGRAVPPAGA